MKKAITNFAKKINIFCLVFACVFGCGCTGMQSPLNKTKLSVVAVNFAQYDFARAVCGDRAELKMIIRPGAEVHGYEPSLADIKAIENADVFVYGGGESDMWIKKILTSVNTDNIKLVSTMDLPDVKLYREESSASVHHGHSHHHEDAPYDEHIWTSPKNAIAMVDGIKNAIVEADSKNQQYYEKNAADYIKKLRLIDLDMTNIAKADNKFIAFADRFPFLYLAKDYGLEYMAAFSGCSPESDAGPSVIARMTEEIKARGLKYVFHIELSNEKMAEAICEHTGAGKLMLHSCQSISREDFLSGITYAELMGHNLSALKEALKK